MFSRTENRILGALARLDDFLMNPLLPGHSGTTPEPSRNALNTSQGTNKDDSQNDSRPEAGLFHGQLTRNSGPEDGHDSLSSILRFIQARYLLVSMFFWIRRFVDALNIIRGNKCEFPFC